MSERPILVGSVDWDDWEVVSVWAALRAQLAVIPDIEPKRKHLLSALAKLTAALSDEYRLAAAKPLTQDTPEPRQLLNATNRQERRALSRSVSSPARSSTPPHSAGTPSA